MTTRTYRLGLVAPLADMFTPRVVELPRRLEPVGRDTFLAGCEPPARRPVSYVGNVIALRPRDELAGRRPPTVPAAPAAA